MFELLFDEVTYDLSTSAGLDDFDLDDWSEVDEELDHLMPDDDVLFEEVWSSPYSNL